MTKLIRADMIRMFRTRAMHLMMLLFAGLMILEGWIASGEDVESEGHVFSSIIFGMGSMLLPMFVSIGICLIIGAEFNNGGIRNKMTVGHTRQGIYGSWLICSFVITLVMEAVLIVSSLAAGFIFGKNIDISDISVKALVINILVMTVCTLSFTALIVLFCTLFTGYKSVAVAFIYNEALMMIFSLMGELFKSSEGYKLASRFFIQAQMKFYTAIEVTDSPWLTVLCSGSLGIAATIAGIVSFRRQDMK